MAQQTNAARVTEFNTIMRDNVFPHSESKLFEMLRIPTLDELNNHKTLLADWQAENMLSAPAHDFTPFWTALETALRANNNALNNWVRDNRMETPVFYYGQEDYEYVTREQQGQRGQPGYFPRVTLYGGKIEVDDPDYFVSASGICRKFDAAQWEIIKKQRREEREDNKRKAKKKCCTVRKVKRVMACPGRGCPF